jgi:D-glycero-D-manno-heptose 1,7-bisphosphate phosphatase
VQPAVFLDRDNTLIANDGDLGDPDAVVLIEGVAEGVVQLHDAGYRLIVVTNQGGVARGVYSESDVDAVHQRIARLIDEAVDRTRVIDRFYYCPYHPDGTVEEYRREHPWRKPRAGMLLQAAEDMGIDLAASWMIGDQDRDIEAGQAAGCRTVMLVAGDRPDADDRARPTSRVTTFTEAVEAVLSHPVAMASPVAGVIGRTVAIGAAIAPLAASVMEQKPVDSTTRIQQIHERLEGQYLSPGEREQLQAAPNPELQQAINELSQEMRAQRQRRAEFTPLRLAASLVQLFVVVIAILGLVQIGQTELFFKWMIGAAVGQLAVLTLLVMDLRG